MAEKQIVLVIDDEEAIGTIVRLYLERSGQYEVIAATTGEEGLRLARERRPHLILLDIYMPEMSGPEVMEALVEDPDTAEIPVVFLTGVVTSQDVEAGKGTIGGRRYIPKPITSKRLDRTIRSVLKTTNW